MKKLFTAIAVVLVTGSLAMAQATTAPSSQIVKVMVIPFKQVGDPSSHEWVAGAIQESLMSAASKTGMLAMSLDHPLANADVASAMRAANDVGASMVVFGSFQYSGDQLRVSGQVADVATGRVLANLSATGPTLDLFKIEDALAGQVAPVLPQVAGNMPQVTYGPNQSTVPYDYTATNQTASQYAPQTSYAPQTYVAAQNDYFVYPYGNSYAYRYSPPVYYQSYPLFIYGGFRFHDRDFHQDFDRDFHRDFDRGFHHDFDRDAFGRGHVFVESHNWTGGGWGRGSAGHGAASGGIHNNMGHRH